MTLFTFNTGRKGSDVSEQAVNQAMNECPKTTDTELDIYQQNIVDAVSKSLADARHSALERLNGLDSTRNSIESLIEGFSFDGVLESVRQKVIYLHAEWHEVLNTAKKEERSSYRNYQLFIHQNKLTREAVYPDSNVFHWALVVLAVLLESVVNSFFFAGASDIGILGGLFQALFISLSNIGSALLIGTLVLPYKNHVEPKKRVRAKAVTFFYIIFIFVFNLAAAHYRTLLEDFPLDAGIKVIPHLMRDPFGISFEACNLMVMGMLFVIVALIKGYRSDDVYPGFGAIHRKFKSSSNHHGKRLEAMRAIKQAIDEGARQAEVSAKDARRQIQNYKDTIFQSGEVVSGFAEYLESADGACNNALWEYREANMRVRSSKPPAYFSERHSLDKHRIEVDLKDARAGCSRIEARLQKIENKEKQKLYDGLREINEKAMEALTEYFETMDKDSSSLIQWKDKGGNEHEKS